MEKWEDRCDRTPMDLNNVKILIGSVKETITRKIVFGNTVYTKALLLLNTLVYSIEYAMKQLEAGHTKYEAKIRTLKQSLQKLQYECDSICIYKEQYKFVAENAKPGCVPELAVCEPQELLQTIPITDVIEEGKWLYVGVFAKDHFTNDSEVDKMLILNVEVTSPSTSAISFKGTNLVGMTTPVLVNFSEISDLNCYIENEGTTTSYSITYRLSKENTNTYTTNTCDIGSTYSRN